MFSAFGTKLKKTLKILIKISMETFKFFKPRMLQKKLVYKFPLHFLVLILVSFEQFYM